MPCRTPIVLLVFRRPALTAQVFKAIRNAQPTKVLIVADGPRSKDEIILCQAARTATEQVDWDCEVFRNYSKENLGCRYRVSSGLDWAFSIVEEAIILEDDCVPHPDFFTYCSELLEHYRYDPRIMVCSGSNQGNLPISGDASYSFSIFPQIWGWATWRRAWQMNQASMHFMEQPYVLQNLELRAASIGLDFKHFLNQWQLIQAGKLDSWAYVWTASVWLNSGLCIRPRVNLIGNIGFNIDATHTVGHAPNWLKMPTESILPIRHPGYLIHDLIHDTLLAQRFSKPKPSFMSKVKLTLKIWIKTLIKQTSSSS
ncbi:glycosyltransferase family 2 protein [Nodosilinea sp. LEGE 07298]|uniref:glycosyltransferase family 2 protein n=1 Tax=Nodosilinea sp. LEGE 07298 TaxID=2777970 RepID=UPI00188011E6|nr:glycosyltransferase family 2 protein [Nodosilinea sp. LEGE 07298]MBE9109125.1 glycosyltransferase family 2 protein [Nodosilinea sp. LEGE 07298]